MFWNRKTMRQLIGAAILFYSTISLLFWLFQLYGRSNVDFPCYANPLGFLSINAETRLAFCISVSPHYVASGAGIYDFGSTQNESLSLTPKIFWYGSIELERRGNELVVNGTNLKPGQSYKISK